MARLGVALLPLLVAGALGLAGCGDGAAEESTALVIERLLRLGQDPDADVTAYVRKLPEGIPAGLPRHPRSQLIASFVVEAPDEDLADEEGEAPALAAEEAAVGG